MYADYGLEPGMMGPGGPPGPGNRGAHPDPHPDPNPNPDHDPDPDPNPDPNPDPKPNPSQVRASLDRYTERAELQRKRRQLQADLEDLNNAKASKESELASVNSAIADTLRGSPTERSPPRSIPP